MYVHTDEKDQRDRDEEGGGVGGAAFDPCFNRSLYTAATPLNKSNQSMYDDEGGV